MSVLDESATDDPLRALRAQDHRPAAEIWRSRIRERWASQIGSPTLPRARLWLIGLLTVPIAIAIGWQAYVATEPPVEDTLPFAGELPAPTQVPAAPQPDRPVVANPPVDASLSSVVVVHVAGAVHRPGIVEADADWRVNDAVRAAGGALPEADLDRVNLAAPLVDGERLFVPEVGEVAPEVLTESTVAANGDPSVVDINSAGQRQLETLPGVGPVTASSIVDHRDVHGPFANVDALVAVRGIGPATIEQLRTHVRAG